MFGDEEEGKAPDDSAKDSSSKKADIDPEAEEAEEGDDTEEASASDEEKGEKTYPRFFDPKKVPKELQPTFKAMQTSFVKKMQELSGAGRKARAFDELVANPDFRAWMEEKSNPTPKRKVTRSDDDEEGEDTFDPRVIPDLVEKSVAKALAPILQKEHKNSAQAEWNALLEDYPQAENYKAEIREILDESPNLSYAAAFKQAAFDDAMGLGVKAVSAKKKANTGKPSGISNEEKAPPRPKSIPEAFKLAVKQQKERGR